MENVAKINKTPKKAKVKLHKGFNVCDKGGGFTGWGHY